MLPTCKANGVPGETGWLPLLRLGWRKSGYREVTAPETCL
jgi:hypothetical protein